MPTFYKARSWHRASSSSLECGLSVPEQPSSEYKDCLRACNGLMFAASSCIRYSATLSCVISSGVSHKIKVISQCMTLSRWLCHEMVSIIHYIHCHVTSLVYFPSIHWIYFQESWIHKIKVNSQCMTLSRWLCHEMVSIIHYIQYIVMWRASYIFHPSIEFTSRKVDYLNARGYLLDPHTVRAYQTTSSGVNITSRLRCCNWKI